MSIADSSSQRVTSVRKYEGFFSVNRLYEGFFFPYSSYISVSQLNFLNINIIENSPRKLIPIQTSLYYYRQNQKLHFVVKKHFGLAVIMTNQKVRKFGGGRKHSFLVVENIKNEIFKPSAFQRYNYNSHILSVRQVRVI